MFERVKDAESYLWVDAICIDRAELMEKGIQVPSIVAIYSKCQCV